MIYFLYGFKGRTRYFGALYRGEMGDILLMFDTCFAMEANGWRMHYRALSARPARK